MHGSHTAYTLLSLVGVVMVGLLMVRVAIIAARGVRLFTAFRAVCIGLLTTLTRHREVRVVGVGDLGSELARLL